VEQLGVPTIRDEDVSWLDVAVNDASAMRGIEGIRDFQGQFQQPIKVKRREVIDAANDLPGIPLR
jgi:hypothetical protein